MQISKFSDAALRILIHLAVAGEDRVSAGDIAERQGVSIAHFAKIAHCRDAPSGGVAGTAGLKLAISVRRQFEDYAA